MDLPGGVHNYGYNFCRDGAESKPGAGTKNTHCP